MGIIMNLKKVEKRGELISKFIVVRTDLKTNKKETFSIYEKYGSRFSNNYKKKEHNPFNSLVRNIEGVLIVDIINSNNPLHENSEIYNICAL